VHATAPEVRNIPDRLVRPTRASTYTLHYETGSTKHLRILPGAPLMSPCSAWTEGFCRRTELGSAPQSSTPGSSDDLRGMVRATLGMSWSPCVTSCGGGCAELRQRAEECLG
jgi:hypothetical protein